MKTSSTVIQKLAQLFFIGLLFYSCDPENPIVPFVEPEPEPINRTVYIGNFDNQWEVEGTEDYFIGIFRAQGFDDTSAGELTGDEQHPVHGNGTMINGNFDGLDIEFTIEREDGTIVEFTGTMTPTSETDHQIIRMDLTTSDDEELVLTLN